MTAFAAALDVRPLLSLFSTRGSLLRAMLLALLPLGMGWLAFAQLFNDVEVRTDDSDFVPQLALVAVWTLPFVLGHVVGLTLAELSRRPATRLFPGRRPRTRGASLVAGFGASALTGAALAGWTGAATVLAAGTIAILGYAAGVASAAATRSGTAWLVCLVSAYVLLMNVDEVAISLEAAPPLVVAAVVAAVALHALPFTRWGDRPHAATPRRAPAVRSVRVPGPGAIHPDARARAARSFETAHSAFRGDLRSLFEIAFFVTALAAVGPLLAEWLDRAPADATGSGLTARLRDGFVGRTPDGAVPGKGTAGASFTLTFGAALLPLLASRTFLGTTFRPISRATLGRLAFRVWRRTMLLGTLALLAVGGAAAAVSGGLAGTGVPDQVPVFARSILWMLPFAPWMSAGALVVDRFARRSGAVAALANFVWFAATLGLAWAAVAVARDDAFDAALAPAPVNVAAYLVVLGAGVAAIRWILRRHFARSPLMLPTAT